MASPFAKTKTLADDASMIHMDSIRKAIVRRDTTLKGTTFKDNSPLIHMDSIPKAIVPRDTTLKGTIRQVIIQEGTVREISFLKNLIQFETITRTMIQRKILHQNMSLEGQVILGQITELATTSR
jgi:hypothetical protein